MEQRRFNIVFVISSLAIGGAERVMTILANTLAEQDHAVTIVSKDQTPSFYPLHDKVNLHFCKTKINYGNKVGTFFGRLGLYRDMFVFFRKKRPDVVIPFSTTTNGAIIVICRLLGLPVIASEHMNYKTTSEKLSHRFIRRYVYPHADYLTVLTKRDKEEYYSKFMKNVVVMPNPLSLKPFNNDGKNTREPRIIAIGDLNRWKHKGFDSLLQIFSKVREKHPGWTLSIAGGGEKPPVEGLIEKFGLTEHVSLLGQVKDIHTYLQSSSIFALPSRWEGLPLVLVEAMSQGIACIAFDCFTGPAEMITHDYDGILVEDQNVESFEKELIKLIEHEDLRKKLGDRSIESSRKFLPEEIVKKWLALIEKTI